MFKRFFFLWLTLAILPTSISAVLAYSSIDVKPDHHPALPNSPFAFCDAVTEIPQAECEALVVLYNSTNGPNWTNNSGWLETTTPSNWYRVSVSGGHVVGLSLGSNQLSGNIPPELGSLTNLWYLYLGDNQLSGSIPPELGGMLIISELELQGNQLSGSIPSELGSLTNLWYLYLHGNQLSGSIPPELGDLVNLNYLNLSGNQLSGSIPSELGDLVNLNSLNLSGNQLSGSIPSELGDLVNLNSLNLSGNQLSGSIPSELGSLTNLWYLYLHGNQLSGSIPPELGSLTNLSQLQLKDNLLNGEFPGTITNLVSLNYFDFDCTLTSSDPDVIAFLIGIAPFVLQECTTTGKISGYIFAADGSTVITDTLISVHAHGITLGSSSLGTYVSQSDGSYTITGLTPGTYKVQANNNREPGYVSKYYDDKLDWDLADTIEVGAGQTTSGINFTLEPNGSISGAIYNEDGSSLIPNVMYGIASTESKTHFTTWCSGDGYFSQTVELGTYKVFAQGDSADCGGDPHYAREYWQEEDNWESAKVITLTATSPNVTGIAFTLESGPVISGYVYEADGVTPISGASLWASIQDGYYIYGTHSEPDGSYILGGLISNTYKLRATANDLQPEWYLEKYREGDADPIVITSSEMISDINFTLEPGGSISGHVYQADGVTPIPNVNVSLDGPGFGNETCTDINGAYRFDSVGFDIAWRVRAAPHWDNGCGAPDIYIPQYYQGVSNWDDATILTLSSGTPSYSGIDFSLEPGGSISGHVYQDDGITPIPNARVDINIYDQNETVVSVQTDAQGYYRVTSLESRGDYKVQVSANGYLRAFYPQQARWSDAVTVSVLAGQTTTGIDVYLLKGDAYITGTVTYENGEPATNVWMEAFHNDGWFVGISANENGEYQIPVISGTWQVFPYNPPYNADSKSVFVNSGETISGVNFTLEPGGSISGHVYQADGVTPIPNVNVSLDGPGFGNETCTDINGAYSFDSVAFDIAWRVRAAPHWDNGCGAPDIYIPQYYQGVSNWDDATILTLSSGTPSYSDINFTLEPGGSISGHVYQADGITPIPNAWVYAMDTQFQFITGANSQTNGSYLISGLTQGSYYLAVKVYGFGGVYYPNGYDDPHAESVIVIPPDTTPNINFMLSPEATASGFVYQSDGVTPISNAHITIWPQHGGQVRGAYSSANGSYTAHGLSTGSYVAKAEAAGRVWEFYLNATSWGSATPFSVVQPQNTDGITFTLSTITETVEMDPTSGGSLVYTDTTGSQTSILVPPGAVTTTITLEYKSTSASSTPPNLAFAGKSFELNAFQGAQQLENFVFQIPVTITIEYTDQDVLNLNENDLTLYYWDELVSEWVDVATSCTPSSRYIRHPDENWLAVPICHLSQFSLFGKSQFKIFLPMVIR